MRTNTAGAKRIVRKQNFAPAVPTVHYDALLIIQIICRIVKPNFINKNPQSLKKLGVEFLVFGLLSQLCKRWQHAVCWGFWGQFPLQRLLSGPRPECGNRQSG